MSRFLPTTVAIAATLLVAGCGSSDYGGSKDGDSAKANQSSGYGGGYSSAPSTKTAAIATRKGPEGTYLVDGQGRSLYLFEADKTSSSTCKGACADAWPPVSAKSKAGHPLYRYAGDQAPGDTAGQGLDQFGAEWYLVKPDGSALR